MLEEYGEAWEAEEAEEEETAGEQAEEAPAAAEAAQIEKGNGRKSQHGEAVQRWRAKHPTGSKKGCARDLGVSLPTVRRHWQIDA